MMLVQGRERTTDAVETGMSELDQDSGMTSADDVNDEVTQNDGAVSNL